MAKGQQVSDILKGEGCEMHNYLNRSGMSSTGELIDTEKVTISSEGRRWKSACKSNSLASYPTSRTVLRGAGGEIPPAYSTLVALGAGRDLPGRRQPTS